MTAPSSIAVTGATGGVGGAAVRRLLATAPPATRVAALVRRPEAVPAHPRLEVRGADYDDPASLRTALAGVETLVFVSSDGTAEAMLRHHENVVAAAGAAGVGHVVYTSILDVDPASGFFYTPGHIATEALLAASGLGHSLARTSVFADFVVATWIEPALVSGTLELPAGDGRASLVTRGDVGRALAGLALSGERGAVALTGPEALSLDDICARAASVTGRAVRRRPVDDATYRRELAAAGAPGWLVEAYASLWAAVREGRFAAVAGDVERLTGVPPQTYADHLEAEAVRRR